MLTLKERGTQYWKRAEIALGVSDDEIFDLKSFSGAMNMLEYIIKKSLTENHADDKLCKFVFFVPLFTTENDKVGYQMITLVYDKEDQIYPIKVSEPLTIETAIELMRAEEND